MNNSSTINGNMMEGNTIPVLAGIPTIVIYLAAFIINTGFLAIGIQALKKTFHNLLVLLLCFNDGFLGFMVAIFTIMKLNHVADDSTTLCMALLIVLCHGCMTSFAVNFLLCFARFVTIRYLNKGFIYKLEQHKGSILVITHLVSLAFVLIINISVQETTTIHSCSPLEMYGKHYYIFIICIWVPMFLLVLATSLMYILCCYYLWKIFSKNTRDLSKKMQEDIWEVRAFKTNLLVAFTTICLTGPFVITFLYDLFAQDYMLQKTRHIVSSLGGISYILDPFIYAYRVPQIRNEMKKKFLRN